MTDATNPGWLAQLRKDCAPTELGGLDTYQARMVMLSSHYRHGFLTRPQFQWQWSNALETLTKSHQETRAYVRYIHDQQAIYNRWIHKRPRLRRPTG